MAAKRLGELGRGACASGDHQEPAGVAVEAVHEARPLALSGERRQHAVEVTPGPGAALHREPGRLVEDQERGVLVQDPGAQPVGVALVDDRGRALRRRACGGRLERRDANALPGAQAGAGLRAPAVDPHLTGAQQLLQPAVAQGGEVAAEPAIEPELGLVRGDRAQLDPAHLSSPRARRSFAQPSSFRRIKASAPSSVGR